MSEHQRIIDACTHNDWVSQNEVTEYLPRGWQEYVGRPMKHSANMATSALPPGGKLIDLEVPYQHPGAPRGSHSGPVPAFQGRSEFLKDVFSDPRVVATVLTPSKAMLIPADNNPPLTVALCRAINDWTIEQWLEADPRLLGSIIVPTQLPDEAAAEIRRVAKHPHMVQVLLCANGLARPFGHPVYHPIYAAAAETSLAIAVHTGGDAIPDNISHPAAGGLPLTYSEYRALAAQTLAAHAVSLIGQGVFEKYRMLNVVLLGGGLSWVPSLVWRFNRKFESFGSEAPWLKRLPGEYFVDHFLVSTWPVETAPAPEQLQALLGTFEGMDRVACYGSGFPDPDSDTLDDVRERIPAAWRSAVFHDNVLRAYQERLPHLAKAESPL